MESESVKSSGQEEPANLQFDRKPELQYSDEREGLRWPASGLSSRDMAKLRIIGNAINKPTTRLLRDAVQLLWDATEKERSEAIDRSEAMIKAYRIQYEQSLKDGSKRTSNGKARKRLNSPTIDPLNSSSDASQLEMAVAETISKPRTTDGTGLNT